MSTSNGHHSQTVDDLRPRLKNTSSGQNETQQVLFAAFNAADKTSHFKICQLVRAYSERCSISSLRDEHGQTLLHIACARMSLGTVKVLVEDYGFDPTIEDNNGVTPIMIAQRQRKQSVSEYFTDFPRRRHKMNGTTSILRTQKPKRTTSQLRFADTEDIILSYEESEVPRNLMSPRSPLNSTSNGAAHRQSDHSGKKERGRGVSIRAPEDVNTRDRTNSADDEKETFQFVETEAVDGDFNFATYRDIRQRQLSLEKEEERQEAMTSCMDKMTSCLKFSKMMFTVLILLVAILVAIGMLAGLVYLLRTRDPKN